MVKMIAEDAMNVIFEFCSAQINMVRTFFVVALTPWIAQASANREMMAPVEFSSLSNHAISWESAALNAIDRIRIVSLSPTRENMLICKGCVTFHIKR